MAFCQYTHLGLEKAVRSKIMRGHELGKSNWKKELIRRWGKESGGGGLKGRRWQMLGEPSNCDRI